VWDQEASGSGTNDTLNHRGFFFGTSYRCHYRGHQYELKHYPDVGKLDSTDLRKVYREALIMQLISHPNVTRLIGADLEDGIIISELAICSLYDVIYRPEMLPMAAAAGSVRGGGGVVLSSGTSASSSLRSSSSLVMRLQWMLDIARALWYLHAHDIVHRDLQPTSIYIMRANNNITTPAPLSAGLVAKLAGDFGIAYALRTAKSLRKKTGGGIGGDDTHAHHVVEEAHDDPSPYIAPELVLQEDEFHDNYDETTTSAYHAGSSAGDIYSFGVIINQLFIGEVPYYYRGSHQQERISASTAPATTSSSRGSVTSTSTSKASVTPPVRTHSDSYHQHNRHVGDHEEENEVGPFLARTVSACSEASPEGRPSARQLTTDLIKLLERVSTAKDTTNTTPCGRDDPVVTEGSKLVNLASRPAVTRPHHSSTPRPHIHSTSSFGMVRTLESKRNYCIVR
jgi:serine/threonine protein kinase